MTQAAQDFDEDDIAAAAVYDAALAEFTDALNRLHIEFGAPSYSEIVKASERPKLSRAGINEALSGKRLPSLDALVEFVRVVTNSGSQTRSTAPGHAAFPERVGEWRERWREVKYRQREVQAPARRVRRATKTLVAEALAEAESVRAQAHEQAERIRNEALAQADHVSSQARQDAVTMKQQTDELWFRVEREVEELRQRTRNESAQILQDAGKRAEEIIRAANDRLSEAEVRAQEMLQQPKGSKIWPPSVRRSEALRQLRDAAQQVVRGELYNLIDALSRSDPQHVDVSVKSVGTFSNGEINQLARTFDEVLREAVRLAAEQALLRTSVNAMFINLSRRSQSLIQRQLLLIAELQSREADPGQLSSLFKLDHLATRMRRNGENLLFLAGEEPGRRWTSPVTLVDVLRAAASEVEQYDRIELVSVPATGVADRVVNDLVHLLAELLENATSFSPPHTTVKATGHALPDGRALIEIHDTGIGLSPEDLTAINERLASPLVVDLSVSQRMGLYVVSRLSQRHGIRIQLRPSGTGGITALVMLPVDVVAVPPAPESPAPGPAN
ncbi:ATP-binding protein [Streptomyces galilaeus]